MNLNSKIISEHKEYSYQDVLKMTEKIASELNKNNVLHNRMKCAVLCLDSYNTMLGILACFCADMIAIPLSLNYGEQHCSKIIEESEPDLIITDHIEVADKFGITIFDIVNLTINKDITKMNYIKMEDISLIMYTSGTTGKPKGALISEQGLISNIKGISEYFAINKKDSILIARPLYHCAVLTGELLVSLYLGVNICFYNQVYNPINIVDVITKNGITVMCGTPTLFSHLSKICCRIGKKDILRVIALSGECLKKITALEIRKAFISADIYNVYGLTEASPRVSFLHPSLFDDKPESVGKGLLDTYIRIVDNKYNDLQFNVPGMIIVSSPSVMRGYYRNEELNDTKIINGWLVTGDIGYQDKNGHLFILSRADDMIIKAGMNIYPKEIENSLEYLKFIKEVTAYGYKDEIKESIGIDIVLNESCKNICQREIISEISKILPMYMMPEKVNIVDSLKRNASGKIVRKRY